LNTFAVLDFETTGMSPDQGDRITEVGVVLMSAGQIVDRFQTLVNPGKYIPLFIQSLTGITNAMVRGAPDASSVMHELHKFIGNTPLIAHNASFDRRCLDAEYSRAGLKRQEDFICSLLLSRRLYPHFPSHKLGTLVHQLALPNNGTYHRALADAEMTAYLMARMLNDLDTQHGVNNLSVDALRKLQSVPKRAFSLAVARYKEAG
jgi:DNA polymerase-3 subunit epsilon